MLPALQCEDQTGQDYGEEGTAEGGEYDYGEGGREWGRVGEYDFGGGGEENMIWEGRGGEYDLGGGGEENMIWEGRGGEYDLGGEGRRI